MNTFDSENQIILIDKPAGCSSFHAVAKVRGFLKRKFGHKVKVGHTGTLDPFATGLLILLSGKCTKKSNEFLKLDKVYETTIKLGYISDTGDTEGNIIKKSDKNVDISEIEKVLGDFTGEIEQRPPKFSAIKINGQRAYKLARKGVEFEVPSRKVTVYKLEILEYNYPFLKLRCFVSSGTYIRTLAEDIGEVLGVGAYCVELRRIKVGEYDVKDARKLEEFAGDFEKNGTEKSPE
ncbi:tRNA pseudouridine(55) synthase TruB [Candidatus Saccharibacteria bacterium]|nr:tRNA pseudouridine(55) synthase TruB [Candidatus Saccharibacteria bacterium]